MSGATQNCEFCSSPAHVWFNCTKKPDGWKPDRLKAASLAAEPAPSPRMAERNSESRKERSGQASAKVPARSGSARPVVVPPTTPPVEHANRGRGRPPGPVPFDKKAHDRKKAAERRAKLKEQKP